jgi:hypothetical protein
MSFAHVASLLRPRAIALAVLLALVPVTTGHAATSLSFAALPVGTILTSQFAGQGITFVPYGEGVLGQVRQTVFTRVVTFDYSPGCEFCQPGARAEFSAGHRSVSARLIMLNMSGLLQQATLYMRGYDANGLQVASTAGIVSVNSGSTTLSLIELPSAQPMVSFVLDTGNSNQFPPFALQELTYDDQVSARPDFTLEADGVSLIADNVAQTSLIKVNRLNGSNGTIHFTVSGLPAGVSANLATFGASPGDVPGTLNGIFLRLTAAPNAALGIATLTITGTPTTPGAGFASHTLQISVAVVPAFRVLGPSLLNWSTCRAGDGGLAQITAPIRIVRDLGFPGPVSISVANIVAGGGSDAPASVQISPTLLTFPGSGAEQDPTLSISGGFDTQMSLDVVLQARSGPVVVSDTVHVSGLCTHLTSTPKYLLVLRGSWMCLNQGAALPAPLQHAQVEFFRYHAGWFDDLVGTTLTDANGAFAGEFASDSPGDFYARLHLDDKQGVELFNAEDLSNAWSFDSQHVSNTANGLVDLGQIALARNDGAGTPRCAIWQGAHSAYREYVSMVGIPPLGPVQSYSVVLDKGPLPQTPWTTVNSTRWPDNYPTGSTYQTNRHEFGHAIRQSLDGDFFHFVADAAEYDYARQHWHCMVTNDGFAFNEGWAEYWSDDNSTCTPYAYGFGVEGNVANDLQNLASHCFGLGIGDAAQKRAAEHKGMIGVLQQGQNIVHSDADFRARLHQLAPGCALPAPTELLQRLSSLVPRPLASALPGSSEQPPAPSAAEVGAHLQQQTQGQAAVTATLRQDLPRAQAEAAHSASCRAADCNNEVERIALPALIRGRIALSDLLAQQLTTASGRPDLNASESAGAVSTTAFERKRLGVLETTLDDAMHALASQTPDDPSGVFQQAREQLSRVRHAIEVDGQADEVALTILKLPLATGDDAAVSIARPSAS